MYRSQPVLVLVLVLVSCGRPADEDCWRGPVPIVRECPCDCAAAFEAPTQSGVGLSLYATPAAGRGPAERPREALSPITLQLSQLLIDPADVPDRDGEWIEIHNPTPLPADLRAVEVAVNGGARCDLSGLTLPAFGYLLLARKATPRHRACPGLSLPNKRGEIAMVRCGEVLDVMVWEKAPKGERIVRE